MRIRLAELSFVSVVAFMSWLFIFSLECYFRDGTVNNDDVYPHSHPPFPDHLSHNLFWFLQITDIHFSFVNNMSISTALQTFCHEVIRTIDPALVIVSGDLTHAKFADERLSQQFLSEWKAYWNVIQKCNLSIPWLDIRGNHDAFNVPSFFDKSNYFMEYSISWKNHNSRSYSYSHQTPFGIYNFIALDVCPNPGPKRPYNFFGVLHQEDLLSLRKFSRMKGNHTVWFTHYPSATISTDHGQLRQLMSSSVAHLCGHLHTLGGLVPHMYGRHPNGHLELELGDFRYSRSYRLMAFDFDLFSFVDVPVGKWPVVLITNPKNAKFLAPSREPTKRMLNSTHIRILAFSPAKIAVVELEVDGQTLPTPVAVNGGPLYVSPWQPGHYASGLHHMRVVVEDTTGHVTVYEQPFSLDGTLSPIEKFPQFLLLTDLHSLFRLGFFFIWLALLSSLCLSWINFSERSYFYNLVRTKSVFYPYLLFVTYFGLGPWYVGELTTSTYGLVFVHGVYLMGKFIPGSMTYLHGIVQLILVQIPLLYYLNHGLSRNLKTCHWWTCNCVMISCVLFQFLWGLTAYPYGYIALILSPGGTWPLFLIVGLIFQVFRK